MSGHTPGEWVVDEFYEDAGCYRIRAADENICHVHAFVPHGSTPEADANARLIAAAPDLLAALKLVLEENGTGAPLWEDGSELDLVVRAAIARASLTHEG